MAGVSWHNVKINEDGDPEDLIIVVKGALILSGQDTEINAIVYTMGTFTASGEADIDGAITAHGVSTLIGSEIDIDYDDEAIEEADFNGMCENNFVASCEVFFPSPLAKFGALSPVFNSGVQCNGGTCSVDTISRERLPTIPSGGNDQGEFNKGSLSDQDYNFFNNWKSNRTNVTFPASSGTAVIYIESNGEDIILPENTRLNVAGNLSNNPAEVLLVIKTDKRVEIGEGSILNAFVYIVAEQEVMVGEDVTINGAFTVISDMLTLGTNTNINYTTADLSGFDPHGFCAGPPAPVVFTPILDYRFDECSYTGAAGDVFDQQTNFNATSNGNPITVVDSSINQAIDLSVSGTSQWLKVPATAIDGLNDFSIALWFKSSVTRREQNIIHALADDFDEDEDDDDEDELNLYLRNNDEIGFKVEDDFSQLDSSKELTDGNWHHLVVTRQGEDSCLYIDGLLQDCDVDIFDDDELEVSNSNAVVIGQEQDSYGGGFESLQSFEGFLDEFKIYDSKLPDSEIQAIYANELAGNNYDGSAREAVSCPVLDHFQIIHDGNGLTCEAETVTIKACADADCTTLNANNLSVDFIVDGVTQSSPNFTGSTTVNFNHTVAETVTMSLANASITPENAFICANGASNSCDVMFKETGFRFFSNTEGTGIPTQLSGKPSKTGFNSSTLKVQAIERNPDKGGCQATFINTKSIEVAATCIDPVACISSQVSINNLTTATDINTLDNGAALTYSSVGLDFSDNTVNSAEFIFTYPDAGKLQLHARYNIPDENGDPSGNFMLGSSNTFIVRPFAFDVFVDKNLLPTHPDYKINPAAIDASRDVFTVAGGDIRIRSRAVAWKVDNDANGNGLADQGEDLTENLITANFTNVSLTSLTHQLIKPATGGEQGTLAVTNNSSFSGGTQVSTATYSEVGIISLTALTNDYLSTAGVNVQGGRPYVGRFIPDRFELVSKFDGDLKVLPHASFAYVGQLNGADGAITYSEQPEFIIKAVNILGGETKNYTINDNDSKKDFMKLTATQVILEPITTDDIDGVMTNTFDGTNGVDGTPIDLDLDSTISGSLVGGAGVNGQLTFTMDSSNHFTYLHSANSLVAPFMADIDIVVNTIIDSDGVVLADTNATTTLDEAGILKLDPDGVNVRFGRWNIENSYGPETSNLPLTMQIQHWDGSKFVTNVLEGLTAYDGTVPANYTRSNTGLNPMIDPVNKVSVSGVGPLFVSGKGELLLGKPTDGSKGQIRLTYNTVPVWLMYDWDGNGTYLEVPSGIATFGIFRGNDRIIYQREIQQ